MRTSRFPSRASRRSGGALAYVLLVLTAVASLSAGLLMFSAHNTRRNTKAVADKRAFYLAEAGLNEAYHGLSTGKTGQIGSMERPARVDGGFVWVDAEETADGDVSLTSTALWSIGRASVEMVIERREEPLGIFSDGDVQLEAPLLLDGYDSARGTYAEQVQLPSVTPLPGDYVHDNTSVSVVRIAEMYFDYVERVGDRFYYIDSVPRNPIVRTIDARVYFDAKQSADPDPVPVTTGGGGMLASNGDVHLGSLGQTIQVFGDVRPGPDGEVVTGNGTTVTGSTISRPELVELPPVRAPQIALLPGVRHGSATPLVVPPSTVGYEYLDVDAGCQVVVLGPATLVVDTLRLRPGAELALENADGAVQLFALSTVLLEAGSVVSVATESPPDLSLQVVGPAARVELLATSAFHGLIYAPGSTVLVGASFEVYGSLVAGVLDLEPNVRLHFDSGVFGDTESQALPKLVSWRVTEIPAAVRASRGDPLVLLGIDSQTLPTLADAQETSSWMFEVQYYDLAGRLNHFKGPYEDWDSSQVSSYVPYTAVLTEPTAELQGEWTISMSYRDPYGRDHTFEGTMTEFRDAQPPITKVLSRVLVPPGG